MNAAAIIVAVVPHGEHGAVVRFFGESAGVFAAYVPGARSRALRPVLQPANGVNVQLRTRNDSALARASVELIRARTALATARATAIVAEYVTALIARVVQEGNVYPRLYSALDGILDAMLATVDATFWWPAIVKFELLVLSELGFGLDLSHCAATGATCLAADLAFVSPRSAQAVGRAAGLQYASKLLPLPAFFIAGGSATRAEVAAGFRTTGFFLEREVLTGRASTLLTARARMIAMV